MDQDADRDSVHEYSDECSCEDCEYTREVDSWDFYDDRCDDPDCWCAE
jgi:hypothetical protein